MKIRCVKAECPECKQSGSLQLFNNRNGEVRYGGARHYSHLDKVSKKPQFTYCKIENSVTLKTLKTNDISLSVAKADIGQVGQVK